MSKLYLTLTAFLLTMASAMAGPVTKEQAQKKAAAFALKDGRSLSLAKNSVHKAPQSNGQGTSPYYVFDMTDNAGFVIISGDDRTREVIGYTESGSYDEENLPDNMKSWLQMIADRITTLGDDYTGSTEAPVPVVNDGVPMADVIIGPLMSSTWNQGSPYWNQCPFRNGSRCYTGCTATAFAQVMYYHRYPTGATTGVPGYTDDGLTIDALGSTTFNWDAMYNSYGANDNANEEVAKLMRYVGQGALMHYTEGGSGAAFVNAINALKNYFFYPSDIYEIHKDNYSSQDWMNALYSELYYGRPVLIEGYSDNSYGGGHAFVCDGYRNDGCFHINWGWGGWCDGYFSLDVLNPDDDSGMGAAQGSSGYYWHEGAVMNVRAGDGSSSYKTTDRGVATFYQDIDYGGYSISLPEGSFTTSELRQYGISDNDITSLKVLPGYKVTLYDGDNFSNGSKTWTGDTNYVGSDWNDKASSIKIETNGTSGLAGTYKVKNRNSGKYLDLDNNSVEDNTAIVQWDDEGTEAYQQWDFIEVETGVYAIQAAASSGKGLDVAYGSVDNSTQVLLYTYNGGQHQQFILVDKGDGYYQFVARYCGKVVEIPSSSTNSGEWIKIWTNNGSNTQQWQLIRNQLPGVAVATLYQDITYGGYSGEFCEGEFNTVQMKMYGVKDNDITSLKLKPGYQIVCYTDDNFSGQSITLSGDVDWIGNDWNDKISSFKIEAKGVSGLEGKYRLEGYNSHLFWDITDASTADDAMLVQKNESNASSQEFRLTEIGNGVYSIRNLNSGKYIDVKAGSIENRADVIQAPYYPDNKNQQWIAIDKGNGYYQFVARHNAKVVEVPNNGTSDGNELKTWDNNNQYCSWWKLGTVSETYDTDLTDNGGPEEMSHTAVKDAESISMLFDNDPQTKYCANIEAGATIWMLYGSTQQARITSYSLTSANDFQGRDPKSWKLQGSNDGLTWETIDSRSGELFPERYQRKTYEVSTDKSYGFFRLEVTEQYDNTVTVFQLAEWQLYGIPTGAFYPTGIETLGTSAKAQFDIYNMNGQLVTRNATSTNGLPSGIYIINRRKVVVR